MLKYIKRLLGFYSERTINKKTKLIRMTTVPLSLDKLLDGQLKYFNKIFDVIAVSSDDNEYLKFVGAKEDILTYSLDLTRKISPIKDLIALYRISRFILKEKPNIIHTHTPKAGTIGMIAAWLCRVPIRLHTVAGLPLLEAKGTKRKILDFVEKLTYLCASKIYPNSHSLKQTLIQNKYCREDKLKVLLNGSSNGIDTKLFSLESIDESKQIELAEYLHLTSKDFKFIYIGRIVKDKGVNELVNAFHDLSSKYLNVKLILVGPYENHLDPVSVDTLNIIKHSNNIIETGFQDDVRQYLAISDALVFPSYREGFPNVVMQAGAMGLPSIVSDINGCNEIIVDGVNGLIIPPKCEEALYHAMEKFVNSNELVASLSKNSRKMIVERYEQKMVWEAIKNEYDTLLIKSGLTRANSYS